MSSCCCTDCSLRRCQHCRSLLLVLLVYLVVSTVVVPYIGSSLTFSIYYHTNYEWDLQRVNTRNEHRLMMAEEVLEEFASTKVFTNHTRSVMPEFCFAVPTISRPNKVHYLTQCVASLLAQISGTNSVITVLNAEGPTHVEAQRLTSAVHVEVIPRHSGHYGIFTKEIMDYAYGLEWCYNRSAEYAIIVEDDAYPNSNFMERLTYVLKYRLSSRDSSWAFLKLYYPEKWESWISGLRIVPELIAATLFGGLLLVLVWTLIIRVSGASFRRSELLCLYVLSSIFVLYLLVSIGRPHWLSLRDSRPWLSTVVPSPRGCTPAVVYPHAHLANIIKYLRESQLSRTLPLDFVLDRFADESGLTRNLLVPNAFKHIGMVSSLRKGRKANPWEFTIT